MDWMKKEGTAGKVGPCAKFLEEDKFSFQRAISKFVLEHDIPLDLLLNPLSAKSIDYGFYMRATLALNALI